MVICHDASIEMKLDLGWHLALPPLCGHINDPCEGFLDRAVTKAFAVATGLVFGGSIIAASITTSRLGIRSVRILHQLIMRYDGITDVMFLLMQIANTIVCSFGC